MASRFVAALTGACLLVATSRPALAQSVPPPPAPAPAAPVGSVPAPPQAAPAGATPGVAPGLVRAHFHTSRDRGIAKIYHRRGETFAGVCSTPCTADLHPGAALRVVLDDHDDEPHDFTLAGEGAGSAGGEVDVLISRGGKGALAGGIVMTSLGGLTALVGLILVGVATASGSRTAGDLRTAGYVSLLIGGGVALGGIVLIANRSGEARVKVRGRPGGYGSAAAPRREQEAQSRVDMFATEAGSGASRVRAPLAPVATVLSLSF
jgi:hypothetical protein